MRLAVGALLSCVLYLPSAWGAQIVQFSPQGTVANIERVSLTFDKDVIAFGDNQVAPPVSLTCDDAEADGHSRWTDSRRWYFAFSNTLGPGVRCTAQLNPAFNALNNEAVTGNTSFSFQTGGPYVTSTRPYGNQVDEDQVFVLRFNGEVDPQTLVANSRCLVEGLGEAVPVRLITGQARTDILEATYYSRATAVDTPAMQLLQCKRTLPAEADVQLQVGPGVATPSRGQQAGVPTLDAQTFDYTVREAFKASMTCMRENSGQPCNPVTSIDVRFSAPITRADASKIRLKVGDAERSPTLNSDDDDNNEDQGRVLSRVTFAGPLPESEALVLNLPEGLTDDAGRPLTNADQFPLAFRTAEFPPLVKFAASPFGIIERFANVAPGGDEASDPASMAVTLRNVEAELLTRELRQSAGKVSDYTVKDDKEVLLWLSRLNRLDENHWSASQYKAIMAGRKPKSDDGDRIDSRQVSALSGREGVRTLQLPGAGQQGPRPFEVVGVPLVEPGFHVLEIESARLGKSLIESGKPMYVRTSALLTNLGVHIKTGRDDTLVWVTTLDDGKVVPQASVAVLDCNGKELARGETDVNGIWHHNQPLSDDNNYCSDTGLSGLYVSARIDASHAQARGRADFSFALTNWNDGIESWRFNVPTDTRVTPTRVVHTVFDRTLLRAGETVSMKHFVRDQTRNGLSVPHDALPTMLIIEHQGSDQRYEIPVKWVETPTGGLSATNQFAIPETARLGVYSVTLKGKRDDYWYEPGEFRVEEFKLPLLTGHVKLTGSSGEVPLVAPANLTADIQVAYVAGGSAGKLPVTLSGVVRERHVSFSEYDEFSFDVPDESATDERAEEDEGNENDEGDQQNRAGAPKLFLDKQKVVLDGQGGARLQIDALPTITRPQEFLTEASFFDPNGELQTLSQTTPVWPAAVQAGIKTESWQQAGKPAKVEVLALTLTGKPQAGVDMSVSAVARKTYSVRKRLVGGFYSYDNHTETTDLGVQCDGKTDDKGKLACEINLTEPGSIQLVATAKDDQGRASRAARTIWITGAGDLWFGGSNDDRIDVIPARKDWKPGETAEFQVRMPYRHATALVAVEREGVLKTQIVELKGSDPTIRIPIEAEWGPNVYVSVLALRGRVREVPWQSFFSWGWRNPGVWYDAFKTKGDTYSAPTALIDLAKPSFRFGLAEIRVSDDLDKLDVKVSANHETYQVRDKAQVTIQVTTPDGKPASHGTVAFAAVDQALLELAPNTSWNLLDALRQLHSYGVETSTAQMQVVGRRHYGRKALPAGGGGGMSPTRELLDTLLVWKPSVELDADGKATIEVPLNDAITRFQLVAIADFGAERFGTGSTQIVSTQDLQIIPGLPAVAREGDRYQAMLTLRNATQHDMQVSVGASYKGNGVAPGSLPAQEMVLAAGSAGVAVWDIQAPESNLFIDATSLAWTFEAHETRGDKPAADRLAFTQKLLPAVPVRTRQSTLLSVDAAKPAVRLEVSPPAGALVNADGVPRGGLQVHLQSTLAGGLPGVKEWFQAYPYTCLEQVSSRAIGLMDTTTWAGIMRRLPDYMDADGLVSYFPGARYGNEVLTAYLLVISHEAQALGMPFEIPSAQRNRMLDGLQAFAQGKLKRERWSPTRDLYMRKLTALEALSRYDRFTPRMLDSIAITPDRWQTSAIIDWLSLLQRVQSIPQRPQRIEQVGHVLRARLAASGTTLTFAQDSLNDSWWMMQGGDANLARLMIVALDANQWDDDMPRLAQGLLGLQRRGAWRTTTANLLGTLAIEKFARKFEREPVSGTVRVGLASGSLRTFDWDTATANQGVRTFDMLQPWSKAKSDALAIIPNGGGSAWATVRSLAAVPTLKPLVSGYELTRSIKPVTRAVPDVWSRGDVYRVTLKIRAEAPMTWVVLSDPIPAGAIVLGSGLGRDSSISTMGEKGSTGWFGPSFIERSFEAYRAYYEYLPKGTTTIDYTVRLNTAGSFNLPSTRIEALYQPDVFGEFPNKENMVVKPAAEDGQAANQPKNEDGKVKRAAEAGGT
ncbi:alpha-2-macroglobulin [Pusillimonas sp. ANT_WB101]|uniref:alpha-2-macroglobulin family protein n=1 Tax=Pusillimonas sp. ANT_WB101 TaxID=2597356 RepID=UPI0011EBB6DD|nr:MG2 domain-containing protein [Pusillimonas sp. ANT_WB101]KAA0911708.1 alpha-2-macroglobulin [Pusillimonas sp. ANT_WB101]